MREERHTTAIFALTQGADSLFDPIERHFTIYV